MDFQRLGYDSVHHGQGRWNGVAILSKVGHRRRPVAGFDDGRRARPRRPDRLGHLRRRAGRVGLRAQRTGGSRTTTTATSSTGWVGCGPHLDAHHSPGRAARRSWATGTSPPPTSTCGSPAAFEGHPRERAGAGRASARVRDWGLVDTLRERYPEDGHLLATGTTATATSTRSAACASTTCCRPPRWRSAGRADLIDRNARKGDQAVGPRAGAGDCSTSAASRRVPGAVRDGGPGRSSASRGPSRTSRGVSPRIEGLRALEPTPRRREVRRLAAAMRDVIEHLVSTTATTEELAAAADDLEALAGTLRGPAPGPDLPRASPRRPTPAGDRAGLQPGDPEWYAFFDHSPFIGLANPLSPPMYLDYTADRVAGRVTFGSAYEGPPGCVHGGYVAAAFDELLGATQSLSGDPGHDRPPRGGLPPAHTAQRTAARWRGGSTGARAARSTARATLTRTASCAPRRRPVHRLRPRRSSARCWRPGTWGPGPPTDPVAVRERAASAGGRGASAAVSRRRPRRRSGAGRRRSAEP